jgi:deoxycytidylate deaminase
MAGIISEPQSDEFPELIFGIVAPIGVKIDLAIRCLQEELNSVGYESETLKATDLMKEVKIPINMNATDAIQSYREKIAYANELCIRYSPDVMASIMISRIRSFRVEYWNKKTGSPPSSILPIDIDYSEKSVPRQAYILRQLKRPEEVRLLRMIYGKQFVSISIYSSEDDRIDYLVEQQRKKLSGLGDPIELRSEASKLIAQDSKEDGGLPGQNVRDAFPLGDVFLDGRNKDTCTETLSRFIKLLFGNNQITPTRDEYGMYMAKSASLRSSDLSRQVGAAIFSIAGEIVSLGCNEVPKAHGGTYWTSDPNDQRDFIQGADPNDALKNEILVDLIDRLKIAGALSTEKYKGLSTVEICSDLLGHSGEKSVTESKLMDLLEFGRIIHAEMSAISDAARKGLAVKAATLFTTTFPCHICAKHIVAAGIGRVIYLEPFPKSYASRLHKDSIHLGQKAPESKVAFAPFIGVSPFRYRDLFEKGKRKYKGIAQEWHGNRKRPQIDVYFPAYFKSEALVVAAFQKKYQELNSP